MRKLIQILMTIIGIIEAFICGGIAMYTFMLTTLFDTHSSRKERVNYCERYSRKKDSE